MAGVAEAVESVGPSPPEPRATPAPRTAWGPEYWMFSWATKGGLAVLDQALFAGAHFVINILLARWLPPAEYGAFAVAYSVFLLIAAFYGALLLEPMMIFGSGRYSKNRGSYLGILLRGHLALTLPATLLLFGIAVAAGRWYSPSVGRAMTALAVALPLMLLMWVTRRAFYIELRPGWAVAGGAVYFVVLVTVAWWAQRAGVLTPVTAIVLMGIAGLLTGALQLVRLRPRWNSNSSSSDELHPRQVALDHWQYGRWALASVVAGWLPLNIYYFALPAWSGLGDAGALKALMNLANPVLHSLAAFGMLLIPLLVRHRDQGGIRRVRRAVGRVVALSLLGSLAYLALLWSFGAEILRLLYGGKYVEYSSAPILLVGLLPVLASLTMALGVALRALERPDRLFWCYLASGGMALVAGVPLAAVYGLIGALLGVLLSYGAGAVTMFVFLRRCSAEELQDAPVTSKNS